jgi:heme-degrading monooxygenase HmoA
VQYANYAKYNRALFKDRNRREEGREVLVKFFKVNGQQISDLTGFLIMDSETDPRESIVLTFWKSKESMTAFYNEENPILTELVDKLKPLFTEMPVRFDYRVTSFKET